MNLSGLKVTELTSKEVVESNGGMRRRDRNVQRGTTGRRRDTNRVCSTGQGLFGPC